jgi:hypothetical protein
VLRLIFALFDIMLHRRGPDSLPSSPFLFWLLVAAVLASTFAALVVGGITVRVTLVMLSVVGFGFWFVWAVLRLFERQGRFRQTMTAFLGTDVIITCLALPLIPLAGQAIAANQEFSAASVALAALRVWSIDITAFILARALERPYLLTLAISIAYFFLMLSFQSALLPRAA